MNVSDVTVDKVTFMMHKHERSETGVKLHTCAGASKLVGPIIDRKSRRSHTGLGRLGHTGGYRR
jgi:hypothetical protein